MSKHTKEPWVYKKSSSGSYFIYQSEGEGNNDPIAGFRAFPNGYSNAKRIVACVNACEGIPTEVLESGPHRIIQRDAAAERQRDELLAASKELISEIEELRKVSIMGNAGARNLPAFVKRLVAAHDKAKSAIAKAEQS